MLAHLAELPNVRTAETDHGGRLLRIGVDAQPAASAVAVRDLLAELGYEATLLPDSERRNALASVARWYDDAGARELSHEEARTLAPRVAADFADAHELPGETRAHLEQALRMLIEESFQLEAELALRARVRAGIDRVIDAMRAHLDERRLAALREHLLDRWRELDR